MSKSLPHLLKQVQARVTKESTLSHQGRPAMGRRLLQAQVLLALQFSSPQLAVVSHPSQPGQGLLGAQPQTPIGLRQVQLTIDFLGYRCHPAQIISHIPISVRTFAAFADLIDDLACSEQNHHEQPAGKRDCRLYCIHGSRP